MNDTGDRIREAYEQSDAPWPESQDLDTQLNRFLSPLESAEDALGRAQGLDDIRQMDKAWNSLYDAEDAAKRLLEERMFSKWNLEELTRPLEDLLRDITKVRQAIER